MAISFVTVGGARAGRATQYGRTYTVQYRAISDGAVIGPAAIFQAFPISIAATYSYSGDVAEVDAGSFLREISLREDSEDGRQWIVECNYSPPEYGAPPPVENPLDEPPSVAWDGAQWEEVIDVDEDGKPIVNTAGDPFLEGVTRDQTRSILRITRNEPSFSDDIAELYRDTLNSVVFFGKAPDTMKVGMIRAEAVWSWFLADYYWRVSYEFHQNRLGWNTPVRDAGLRQLTLTDPTKQEHILDNRGFPITTPHLLDGSGRKLAVNGTPVALPFRRYRSVDLVTALGMGA
jgi:hypothetical protein